MVKIILSRIGRKSLPCYEIRVKEAKGKRDGKFIEKIGWYQPISKTSKLLIKRYHYWISMGAKPTDSIKKLYKQFCCKNKELVIETMQNSRDEYLEFYRVKIDNEIKQISVF